MIRTVPGWRIIVFIWLPALVLLSIIANKSAGRAGKPAAAMAGRTTLQTPSGVEVVILHLGATIQAVRVPDRNGKIADVVLGFDDERAYRDGTSPYMGSVVGRVANRVAKGTFELDGKRYEVPVNNGPNSLHGGLVGFDKRDWTVVEAPESSGDEQKLVLELTSEDGDQGYPGAVTVRARYTLTERLETALEAAERRAEGAVTGAGEDGGASLTAPTIASLELELTATTTAPTPLSLAGHTYWNLAGAESGASVLNHTLQIQSDYYTPTDSVQIPTGELRAVSEPEGDAGAGAAAATPFDFREPKLIGRDIALVERPPALGYDHNFCLFGLGPGDAAQRVTLQAASSAPARAATLHDPASGRTLRLLTTAPGLQVYSGNFLDGSLVGKGGARYRRNAGVALETQNFPDAVNQPDFPSSVVRPGQTYRHVVTHELFATP